MTSLADLLQAATRGPWRSDDNWQLGAWLSRSMRWSGFEEWYGKYVTVRQTPERFGQGFPVFNDDEQRARADARLIALVPELAAVAIAAEAVAEEAGRYSPDGIPAAPVNRTLYDALAALHQRLAE